MIDPFTYDVPAIQVAPAQCFHVRILVGSDASVQGVVAHHDWWVKLILSAPSGGTPVHDREFYERLDRMEVPS